MKERSGSRAAVDERYAQWKSLIPVLYDWFANHNLVWPSLSCRWGPQFEKATYKNRQRLYLSEQTDGSVPNTLVIANCEVVKPRVAAAEHISQFNEEARSPFVKKYKTIVHPGEVNRIRELPQNSKIIATHTDSPDVLIWDVEAQPNRHAVLGATESRPDLILTGHQENAEFALAMCPAEPYVLSGGKDKSVVLWSIQDHISALGDSSSSPGASGSKQPVKTANEKESPKVSPKVDPRGIFHGHDSTVEDVQFCPSSAQEFCSVGDDACLILWDARSGTSPAVKVEKAHSGDVHCVDWNPLDVNYILTGSADNSVRMWDRRNLGSGGAGSPIHKFEGHKAAVLCVQWSPDRASVFGSSAEDGFLNVWDHEKVGKKKNPNVPAGLFFQHAGHRYNAVGGKLPEQRGITEARKGLPSSGVWDRTSASIYHYPYGDQYAPNVFSALMESDVFSSYPRPFCSIASILVFYAFLLLGQWHYRLFAMAQPICHYRSVDRVYLVLPIFWASFHLLSFVSILPQSHLFSWPLLLNYHSMLFHLPGAHLVTWKTLALRLGCGFCVLPPPVSELSRNLFWHPVKTIIVSMFILSQTDIDSCSLAWGRGYQVNFR